MNGQLCLRLSLLLAAVLFTSLCQICRYSTLTGTIVPECIELQICGLRKVGVVAQTVFHQLSKQATDAVLCHPLLLQRGGFLQIDCIASIFTLHLQSFDLGCPEVGGD